MKKALLIPAIVLILVSSGVVLCYLFGYEQPFHKNESYRPSVTLSVDKYAVAESLTEKYLAHHTTWAVGLPSRLIDYRINRIEMFSGIIAEQFLRGREGFLFTVEYDVRTAAGDNSNWIAGNGRTADDNWIIHKFFYVVVEKQGNEYRVTKKFTGV